MTNDQLWIETGDDCEDCDCGCQSSYNPGPGCCCSQCCECGECQDDREERLAETSA